MRFFARTLLAWLLMLAIPMQGFAVTAMLFCAPSHHGVVSAVAVVQADAFVFKASEHTLFHHEGESNASSSVSSNVGDNSSFNKTTPLKVGKLADGKCSACATCCTGSALVGTPHMNSVAMTGSDSIPFTLESFVSYVPEGFDPPPRSIFA